MKVKFYCVILISSVLSSILFGACYSSSTGNKKETANSPVEEGVSKFDSSVVQVDLCDLSNSKNDELKAGHIQNLDAINGFRQFEFNRGIEEYRNCLDCKKENYFTVCQYKNGINIGYVKNLNLQILFLRDSLVRITVYGILSQEDKETLFHNIQIAYGNPNFKEMKLERREKVYFNVLDDMSLLKNKWVVKRAPFYNEEWSAAWKSTKVILMYSIKNKWAIDFYKTLKKISHTYDPERPDPDEFSNSIVVNMDLYPVNRKDELMEIQKNIIRDEESRVNAKT